MLTWICHRYTNIHHVYCREYLLNDVTAKQVASPSRTDAPALDVCKQETQTVKHNRTEDLSIHQQGYIQKGEHWDFQPPTWVPPPPHNKLRSLEPRHSCVAYWAYAWKIAFENTLPLGKKSCMQPCTSILLLLRKILKDREHLRCNKHLYTEHTSFFFPPSKW